jgi:hypothetical protein
MLKRSVKIRREQWMARYNNIIVTTRPELSGKMDWDTAMYLYLQGYTVEDAVKIYLERVK